MNSEEEVNLSIDTISSLNLSDDKSSYHGEEKQKYVLNFVKHKVSKKCLNDFYNIREKTTRHKVEKMLTTNMIYDFTVYIKCEVCKLYTPFTSKKAKARLCCICSTQLTSTDTNTFLYIPLYQQLVKNIEYFLPYIESYLKQHENVTDIHDGQVYKSIEKKIQSGTIPLCFTLNTDGVQIFDDGGFSLWPLQLLQMYLPPNLRYRTENILLLGLYYGPNDIDFLSYFKPLVQEMLDYKDGFKMCVNNKVYTFLPLITYAAVDIPAKCKLQKTSFVTGKNACSFCHHAGVPVKNRNNNKTTIRYLSTVIQPRERNHIETLKIMMDFDANGPQLGINGLSVMCGFKNFDLIKSFGIDYLHNSLKGVFNLLLDLWYSTTYHKEPFHFTRAQQNVIDERIINFKSPSEITRKTRSIIKYRKDLKANELRSLLLYFLPVAAKNVQKKDYYDHFMLLSTSIYTLLNIKITPNDLITTQNKLREFVNKFEKLYGAVHVTMNIHLLLHMVQCVIDVGPLWTQSMFALEANNGVLAKYVTGTRKVLHQIAQKYTLSQKFKFVNTNKQPDAPEFLSQRKLHAPNDEEKKKLVEMGINKSLINVFEKMRLKSVLYTSILYKETKSIDYAIQIKCGEFGLVKFYMEFNKNKYVCCEILEILQKSNQLMEVKSTQLPSFIRIEEIKTKIMYMKLKNKLNVVIYIGYT